MDQNTAVELIKTLLCESRTSTPDSIWQIGQAYLIRTVTNYWTGRLIAFGQQELVLEEAAWIADTGRFNEADAKGSLNEVEPVQGRVIIGRGSIVDAVPWKHSLPRSVK